MSTLIASQDPDLPVDSVRLDLTGQNAGLWKAADVYLDIEGDTSLYEASKERVLTERERTPYQDITHAQVTERLEVVPEVL